LQLEEVVTELLHKGEEILVGIVYQEQAVDTEVTMIGLDLPVDLEVDLEVKVLELFPVLVVMLEDIARQKDSQVDLEQVVEDLENQVQVAGHLKQLLMVELHQVEMVFNQI
jgi:hypothetical protein